MSATTAAALPAARSGSLLRSVVATTADPVATVLRLTAAVVMFPHGAQKAFGWFGGYGFEGTMGFLTGQVGLPGVLAALVIAIELLAPVALALGLLTRPAALGIGAVMLGAVATSHLSNGFFMNWSGQQAGEGFEYHLLMLAIVAALLIRGGGAASADLALTRRAR